MTKTLKIFNNIMILNIIYVDVCILIVKEIAAAERGGTQKARAIEAEREDHLVRRRRGGCGVRLENQEQSDSAGIVLLT